MIMDHMERAQQLRADEKVHYNCCQSVLIPFATELGLSEQQAFDMGAHFGSGMRLGSTCGAVSGALMVLGGLGFDGKIAMDLLKEFKQDYGATDCATLLKNSHDKGEPRKQHCDGLVFEMVKFLDQLTMKPE